jgi:putative ABC transport system permease protein
MSRVREFAARVAALVGIRRSNHDLDEELRTHLEMLEGDLRASGMDAAGARREARVRFGGVTQAAEAWREQRTLPLVDTLLQDVRYAVRILGRTPLVTTAALVTLALGIGANAAIFSVVHAVLLRPLPYASPDRLVVFGDADADGLPTNMGFATWQDYRDRSRAFDENALVRSWSPTLVIDGEAERVPAMRVSWNYFQMLGVRPALGRTFEAADDRQERWRVLVISDGLWRRRFNADPAVVGRTIRMNDRDYRIVGVLPATFEPLVSEHFYARADMWAALGYDTSLNYACRGCQHLRALGRLREGLSIDSAAADLDRVRAQLAAAYPGEYPRARVSVMRLQDKLAGPVRGIVLTLLAAVGFVLLIACANVANLLLARAAHRSREMALRAALGAGRARLLRQLLTESLVLALAGGALGIALAALSVGPLADMAPVSIPRLDSVRLDLPVLAFAVALSLLTGLAFGLVPARRGATPNLQHSLAAESRSTTGGGGRARRLLIAADLAVALVLLAGAGLMLKSVERLVRVSPGFDPHGVLSMQYSLVGTAYEEDAAVAAFTDRVLERVAALPGVHAVAAASQIPMGGNGDTWGFHIEGRVSANSAENPAVERYSVTPDYVRVMRIPLTRGRFFSPADQASAQPVLVISTGTARALWPGADPIGHRVRVGDPDRGPWRTVIGVVGDVRHTALDAAPTLQMYLPMAQVPDSFPVVTIRADGVDPQALTGPVRAILRELDASVPLYAIAPLAELVDRTVAQRRFVLHMLAAFALVALVLAAVGLYGVVSYTIAQRTREIGVRVALGARTGDIVRLVLGAGIKAAAAGIAVGVIGALAIVRFMDALLFEIEATDPGTLMAAAGVLAIVTLAAHSIPVRRALRIDPATALRQE